MLCRAAVIVFLAIPLMTACGIITAPVTVPKAIAKNTDFHVNATVVDPTGKPLDNVILSQELHHYFWSPTSSSGTVTDERSSRLINGPFTVNERGALLKLHFSRDGYFDQTCIINAGIPTRITTDELINGLREGPRYWVLSPDLHIVMIPRTPDAGLLHAGANCFYSDYPRMWAVTLPPVASARRNILVDSSHPESIPPNTLYLTLAEAKSIPADARGNVDLLDVNLPDSVTIRITGTDTGLQRIPPRNGFDPMRTSDTAPTTGYEPTLKIPRARLREMRPANTPNTQYYEHFFFRADDRYGKGALSWGQHMDPEKKKPQQASFSIWVLMQSAPGNTDLTWHTR